MEAHFVAPGTSIDVINCDKEQIHIPGSIQPHGYTLAFNEKDQLIHVSENFLQRFSFSPMDLLGLKHHDFPQAMSFISKTINSMNGPGSIRATDIAGEGYIARHLPATDDFYILEFEREGEQVDLSSLNMFEQALQTLSYAENEQKLAETLVSSVRLLTGYDRVMVYQFDRRWNGEIIAEDRRSDLEPFLGLHYPASDIPAQARALYQINLSRLIRDVHYEKVPILSIEGVPPLDLTHSRLRSISPVHIQYLQNMQVRGTFVISLIVDEVLWGLIACHHYSGPKDLSFFHRKFVESAARIASLAIGAQHRLKISKLRQEQIGMIQNILAYEIIERPSMVGSDATQKLLSLTRSTGAVLRSELGLFRFGTTPDDETTYSLIHWLLQSQPVDQIYFTDELSNVFPKAHAIKEICSGILAISISGVSMSGSEHGLLIFFRPEFAQTVHWAGNPDKMVEKVGDVLSPRRSFALWKQILKGQSRPWEEEDFQAAKLLQAEIFKQSVRIVTKRRKEAELRLLQAERLSSLGQLAAGVAHDFNNILQGIESVSALITNSREWDAVKNNTTKIRQFTGRGKELIQQLLQYSRSNAENHKAVHGKNLLEEALLFAQNLVPQHISVSLESTAQIENDLIWCNHQEILQCLINLVTNARDAVGPQNGNIKLSLNSRVPTAIEIRESGLISEKSYLFFAVADSGCGISQEHLPRIFDPFFSTKADEGKGTGLGLSNVLDIVTVNGGKILVTTKLGEGSIFTLAFPHFFEKSSKIPAKDQPLTKSAAEKIAVKELRLLYVEDDSDLREVHTELLCDHFKEVTTAVDGKNALEVLQKCGKNYFDLIISDLRMPNMDGMSLYRALRDSGERIPFIIATGELGLREKFKAQSGDLLFEVVTKPFEIDKLNQAIFRVFKEIH